MAASAQLDTPAGVAIDSAGNLYILDRDNRRIRRVSSVSPFQPPVISTIAGNGVDGYSGDGGPALTAELAPLERLAVDSAGRVYVVTRNAVRMLTPVCAVSASPDNLTAPTSGAQLTLNMQAAAGCAWTITGLPAWITASSTSGSGPSAVTLTVAANTGAARSVTMTAGSTQVTVTQAAGGASCLYSIDPPAQSFGRTGGAGTISVSTVPGCPWTAASAAAWVTITGGAAGSGNGTVTYTVLEDTSGAARSGTIAVAGRTFTVEQHGPGLVFAGTLAQVASGGGWKTMFTLVNTGSAAAMARMSFIGGTGAPLLLPLFFPQTGMGPLLAGSWEQAIPAGASLIVESEVPANQDVQQGWAELMTDGAISGFAIFRQRSGDRDQEAVVPLETRTATGYVLAFDNTGGIDTGVAVANLSVQAGPLTVMIQDDAGTLMQTNDLNLPARGHTAFVLKSQYPATAGKRGTIEFRAPAGGQISVLGLRFNVARGGAFTTIPVWAH